MPITAKPGPLSIISLTLSLNMFIRRCPHIASTRWSWWFQKYLFLPVNIGHIWFIQYIINSREILFGNENDQKA